jgi:hypothetical protein
MHCWFALLFMLSTASEKLPASSRTIQPLLGSLRGNAQPYASVFLQSSHDLEEILGIRIAMRREHSMQALARFVHFGSQPFETDCGIDEIAKHRFSRGGVSDKIGIDCFGKHRLPKFGIALRPRKHCFFEVTCQHIVPLLSIQRPDLRCL